MLVRLGDFTGDSCLLDHWSFSPGRFLFFKCRVRREDGGGNGWKAVLRRNRLGVLETSAQSVLVTTLLLETVVECSSGIFDSFGGPGSSQFFSNSSGDVSVFGSCLACCHRPKAQFGSPSD